MSLPSSTPRAQGVDAAGLLAVVEGMQERDLGLHGLAVARHGHHIASGWASPYTADRVHLVYSLSKSLTGLAVALLHQQGRLDLDDPVLARLGVDLHDVDARWARVTVRHCLSMTVGHTEDAWPRVVDRWDLAAVRSDDDWLSRVLANPPTAEPGSAFAYNQVATWLLSLVVDRLAGGIRTLLRPHVLDPLGIGEVPWHTDPQGRELGFTGAHLTTGSVLALAQLVLDRGAWRGRQLVDASWFDRATVAAGPPNRDPEASPDWRRGYGYTFWMQEVGHRGDGAYGQFLVVLPDQDVAVAITSEHEHMQATLDLLWDHLVPAVDRPGSAADEARLATVLDDLVIPPPPASTTSPRPEAATFRRSAAGDLAPTWGDVTVRARDDDHLLRVDRAGATVDIVVGDGRWCESVLEADGWALPVVAGGGWSGDTFVAEVRVIETPHTFRVACVRTRSDDGSDGSDGVVDLTWRLVPLMGPDPFGLAVRRHDDV